MKKERSKLKLCAVCVLAVCYNFKLSVLMENYKASSPLLLLLLSSFFSLFFTFFSRFRIVDSVGLNENFSEKKTQKPKGIATANAAIVVVTVAIATTWCMRSACENTWYS